MRDVYDMGFIAEHYPGDVTATQAQAIGSAGYEAMREANRWTEDHGRDAVLGAEPLTSLGQQVVLAADGALKHIEGARIGKWMNHSQATAELRECAQREPGGRFEAARLGNQARVAWRTPGGEEIWQAVVENDERARVLPMQAEIESEAVASSNERGHQPKHPATRNAPPPARG